MDDQKHMKTLNQVAYLRLLFKTLRQNRHMYNQQINRYRNKNSINENNQIRLTKDVYFVAQSKWLIPPLLQKQLCLHFSDLNVESV